MKISVEQRLSNLEHIVASISNKIDLLTFNNDGDKKDMKQTERQNTNDITAARDGLLEVSEITDVNTDDISSLRLALLELVEEVEG